MSKTPIVQGQPSAAAGGSVLFDPCLVFVLLHKLFRFRQSFRVWDVTILIIMYLVECKTILDQVFDFGPLGIVTSFRGSKMSAQIEGRLATMGALPFGDVGPRSLE